MTPTSAANQPAPNTDKSIHESTDQPSPQTPLRHEAAQALSSPPKPKDSWLGTIGHDAMMFGEGVISGTVLKAANGFDQLVDHFTGKPSLPRIELPNQKDVDSSWAGQMGEAAGEAINPASALLGTHEGMLFTEGVISGAVLNPINGASQLSNEVLGTHLGSVQLDNQKEVDDSWAGRIGEVAGTAADFVALTVATGGVADAVGLSGAGALMVGAGTAGAIQGGVFTPTADGSLTERVENFLIGGLAGSAGMGGGVVVNGLADGAKSALLSTGIKVGGNAIVGAGIGGGATEAGSYAATGHSANPGQLVLGLSVGVAGAALGAIRSGAPDTAHASPAEGTAGGGRLNEVGDPVGGAAAKQTAAPTAYVRSAGAPQWSATNPKQFFATLAKMVASGQVKLDGYTQVWNDYNAWKAAGEPPAGAVAGKAADAPAQAPAQPVIPLAITSRAGLDPGQVAAVGSWKAFIDWSGNIPPTWDVKTASASDIYMFGKNPGFAKFSVDATDATGAPIGGPVYMRGDTAAIAPVFRDSNGVWNMIGVDQYRAPILGLAHETVAGIVDPNDDSYEGAAVRELKEETGIVLPKKSQVNSAGRIYLTRGWTERIDSSWTILKPEDAQRAEGFIGGTDVDERTGVVDERTRVVARPLADILKEGMSPGSRPGDLKSQLMTARIIQGLEDRGIEVPDVKVNPAKGDVPAAGSSPAATLDRVELPSSPGDPIMVKGVAVTYDGGLNAGDVGAAVNSKLFQNWISQMDPRMKLGQLHITDVEMKGDEPVSIKVISDAQDPVGKIPGVAFVQADKAYVAPVVIGPDGIPRAVTFQTPEIAAGRVMDEVPGDYITNPDAPASGVLHDISTTLGLTVPDHTELENFGSVTNSPGGTSQGSSMYAFVQHVSQAQLDSIEHQRGITLKTLPELQQSDDGVSALLGAKLRLWLAAQGGKQS